MDEKKNVFFFFWKFCSVSSSSSPSSSSSSSFLYSSFRHSGGLRVEFTNGARCPGNDESNEQYNSLLRAHSESSDISMIRDVTESPAIRRSFLIVRLLLNFYFFNFFFLGFFDFLRVTLNYVRASLARGCWDGVWHRGPDEPLTFLSSVASSNVDVVFFFSTLRRATSVHTLTTHFPCDVNAAEYVTDTKREAIPMNFYWSINIGRQLEQKKGVSR